MPAPVVSSVTDRPVFAFVDSRIPDYELLLVALPDNVEVVLLDATVNGLHRIADTLAGSEGVAAVHVFSHGRPGALQLGNLLLDAAAVEQHAELLALIGELIAPDGDILLYGCDVAAGDMGAAFIGRLAELTAADIAASTDATGDSSLGGNWRLETHSGAIESELAFSDNTMMAYQHLLAEFTLTTDTDTPELTSGDDTVYATNTTFKDVDVINGLEGYDTLVAGGLKLKLLATTLTNVEAITYTGTSGGTLITHDNTVAAGQTLTIDSSKSTSIYSFTGSAETDGHFHVTGGSNNDTLTGGAGNDTFYGGAGGDSLRGGSGNDVLYGGAGNDNYTGGADADTFAGTIAELAGDTVLDFAMGDTIKVLGADLSALNGAAASATITLADGKSLSLRDITADSGNFSAIYSADDTLITLVAPSPATSSASYDWTTGTLTLTGSHFVGNAGTDNDIAADLITLSGPNGSWTLSDTADVEISSASSATLTLSVADQLQVRGLLNADGSSGYSLALADGWMPGSSSDSALSDVTITVSTVAAPVITSATLERETGVLSVTGSDFFKLPGASNDIDVQTLTLVGGSDQASYTLVDSSDVEISSATTFSITLGSSDKAAVLQLLDQLGTTSSGGSTYNLSAADGWLAAAAVAADIADSSATLTLVDTIAPTLLSSTPADDATAVAVGGNLTLTFSEDVNAVEGSVHLYTGTGSLVESFDMKAGTGSQGGSFAIVGATATLNPFANLDYASDYYILLDAYGLQDTSLNNGFAGITDAEGLNFTTAAKANTLPSGTVTVTGDAAQGETLTASHDLADIDGLGTLYYQWLVDGNAVEGATGSTFTSGQAQVGKQISVRASYTDTLGTFESVTSTATAAIANVNDAASGTVTIAGNATQGETLTASNDLADLDGLGTISYRWLVDGNAVEGATSSTFTLGQAQVGKLITVTARYTDTLGTAESVTSTATAAVANVNDAPTGSVTITGVAMAGETLTAGNTLVDADGLGTLSYQWYANDVVITGAESAQFAVGDAQVGMTLGVAVRYTDLLGTAEEVRSTATAAVSAAPEPSTPSTPTIPATTTTVDGVAVTQTTETTTSGETAAVIVVAPVNQNREEQSGAAALADIPLISSGGETALTIGLPNGVGVRSSEVPVSNSSGESDLVRAIKALTTQPGQSADRSDMTSNGLSFLADFVGQNGPLVRTLTLESSSGQTASSGPVVITGNSRPDSNPVALVIDARNMSADTVLQLDEVQFAAIIGNVRIIGGAGAQIVTGDSGEQFLFLGADDDVLRGGGGNDTVASAAGDDKLYGDDGDDLVVGGSGSDTLEGGAGNDILQAGASDAGSWQFRLQDGVLVSTYQARSAEIAELAEFSKVGAWFDGQGRNFSDARFDFTHVSAERLQLVTLLTLAGSGELPDLATLNTLAAGTLSVTALATQALADILQELPDVLTLSTAAQVQTLIERVLGAGTATSALVEIGVSHIESGGVWSDALVYLLRLQAARDRISDEAGNMDLSQVYAVSESGWSNDAADNSLYGGDGNDRLVGSRGNDLLDGGSGTDVAAYVGSVDDFSFRTQNVDGVVQILLSSVQGGTDTLQGIELLQIGGRYYDASTLYAAETGIEHALAGSLVALVGQALLTLELPGM